MIRYLIFRGYGKRQACRDKIKNIIRHSGLGMQVESLKFQVGGGNEFYYGIGVDIADPSQTTPNRDIHDRLIEVIGRRFFVPNRTSSFFEEHEVEGFLTGDFEYDSFLEPIRFEPDKDGGIDVDMPDPIGMNGIQLNQAMDRLLWWMSAKGEGSWQSFRDAVSLLWGDIPGSQPGPWPIMRTLILLGHVEIDGDGRWGMAPATVIRTAEAGTFLAGKTTPMALCRLEGYEASSSNGGPSRIGLDKAQGFADVPIIETPSSTISACLPDAGEWMANLRGEPDIEPHRYALRRYNGEGFDDAERSDVRPGFYEAERLDGHRTVTIALFDGRRWIGGAFYDLRWLAKKIGGASMEVWVDGNGTLLVPEEERWPILYERPLVLASGRLPASVSIGGQKALAYEAVGQETAGRLAGKLGITLMEGLAS